MISSAQSEEIAKRYGLGAIPESVIRLTRLVAGQDADLAMIATVIAQDKGLSERLLRLAFPRETTVRTATADEIETALMRTGMGSIFVLALGDLLVRAISKTFHTMLGIQLELTPASAAPACAGRQIVSEVTFSGKAGGRVYVHQSEDNARLLTARLLGLETTDPMTVDEIGDAIAEISSMGAGNFLSNLRDAGLPCKLGSPSMARSDAFQLKPGPGGSREQMALRSADLVIFVDICVDEWNF